MSKNILIDTTNKIETESQLQKMVSLMILKLKQIKKMQLKEMFI